MNKLHTNIKTLRVQAGLSQKALAEKLYVSSSTLSNWERGQFEPDVNAIQKLADVFGVSIDALYGRSGSASSMDVMKTIMLNTLHLQGSTKQMVLFGLFALATLIFAFTSSTLSDGFWFLTLVLLVVSEVLLWAPRNITQTEQVRVPKDHQLFFGRFGTSKSLFKDPVLWAVGYFIYGLTTLAFTYQFITQGQNDAESAFFLGGLAVVFMISYLVFIWLSIPWLFVQGAWPVTSINRKAVLMVGRLFWYFDVFLLTLIGSVFLSTHTHEAPFPVWLMLLVIATKCAFTDLAFNHLKTTLQSLSLFTKHPDDTDYEPLTKRL